MSRKARRFGIFEANGGLEPGGTRRFVGGVRSGVRIRTLCVWQESLLGNSAFEQRPSSSAALQIENGGGGFANLGLFKGIRSGQKCNRSAGEEGKRKTRKFVG